MVGRQHDGSRRSAVCGAGACCRVDTDSCWVDTRQLTPPAHILNIHPQYTSSLYILNIHPQSTSSICILNIHPQYTSSLYILNIVSRHIYRGGSGQHGEEQEQEDLPGGPARVPPRRPRAPRQAEAHRVRAHQGRASNEGPPEGS